MFAKEPERLLFLFGNKGRRESESINAEPVEMYGV